MNLLEMLAKPIVIHRQFLRVTGSVTAALLLTDILERHRTSTRKDGWFPVNQHLWHQTTGLTRKQTDRAKKLLKDLDVVEFQVKEYPGKSYARIKISTLSRLLGETPNGLEVQQFVPQELETPVSTPEGQTDDIKGLTAHDLALSPERKPLKEPQFVPQELENDGSLLLYGNSKLLPTKRGPQDFEPVKKDRPLNPEEVRDYLVRVKGFRLDIAIQTADRFFNFYESNGWKVGKNPMKSWVHAVAGWVSREHLNGTGNGQAAKPTNQSVNDIEERDRERRAALGL